MKDVVIVYLHWLQIHLLVYLHCISHPNIGILTFLLFEKYTILPIDIETFSLPIFFK